MPKTLIFLLLLSTNLLTAQDTISRDWSEGPLRVSDFIGEESSFGLQASFASFTLGITAHSERMGDSIFKVLVVQNEIQNNLSWMDHKADTVTMLRFHQATFDLFEVYRRKAQQEINRESQATNYLKILSRYRYEARMQVQRLAQETDFGNQQSSIEKWEHDINRELAKSPHQTLPLIEGQDKIGLALDLGAETQFFAGEMGSYLNPNANFTMGFGLTYQKFGFWAHLSAGQATLKKPYQNNSLEWRTNRGISTNRYAFSVSYEAFDNEKHSLRPFIGLALLELNAGYQYNYDQVEVDFYTASYLQNPQWQLGIDYQFKLFSFFRTNNPYWVFNEAYQLDHSIKMGFYLALNRNSELQGGSVNFRICYNLDQRPVSVKP